MIVLEGRVATSAELEPARLHLSLSGVSACVRGVSTSPRLGLGPVSGPLCWLQPFQSSQGLY